MWLLQDSQAAHHVRDDDRTNHVTNFRVSLQYPDRLLPSTQTEIPQLASWHWPPLGVNYTEGLLHLPVLLRGISITALTDAFKHTSSCLTARNRVLLQKK